MNGWGIFDEKVSGERKKFRVNRRVEPFSLLLYSFYRCVLGWKAHIRWLLGKTYFNLSTFDQFSRSWLAKILEIQVQLPCNESSVNYSRAFDSVEDFWVRKFQFNFDYDLWMARRYVQWMLSILSFLFPPNTFFLLETFYSHPKTSSFCQIRFDSARAFGMKFLSGRRANTMRSVWGLRSFMEWKAVNILIRRLKLFPRRIFFPTLGSEIESIAASLQHHLGIFSKASSMVLCNVVALAAAQSSRATSSQFTFRGRFRKNYQFLARLAKR